ncbi:MAG: CBS domain-containing protein [Rhodospirillales bacterium]|nr:CBS domain-containing protein [Rhodospirillales bacterium]
MVASDIMTTDPVTARPDTPLGEAVRLFLDKRISGLPVLDEAGRLVGMLTEGDLLRRTETGTEREPHWLELLFSSIRLAREYVHTHGRTVGDVMTRGAVAITAETPLGVAVRLMEARRIKRLPVLDRPAGRLVGIISRADLVRALAMMLAESPASPPSDQAIRARVEAEIAGQPWAPSLRDLTVLVNAGTVTLQGVVFHDEQREALKVLAGSVPGVKGVHDQLSWIEPMTGGVVPG